MRHLAIATALLATTLLSAPPALAGDAGSLGLSVGGMLLLTVGGGVVTSVLLGQAVTDDERVHPALRNMGFGFGGVNLALGTAGLIAGALVEDEDVKLAVQISAGAFAALGLTGLTFAFLSDPYPEQQVALAPLTGGGALAVWQGTF
ncbi:MAG: hypothetical protein KC613_02450 [Myxococcales bacterium]|nr:hypothetical protein [Myxococcales bacterium]MCB9524658.1 hypothetical protein [Myxococcales bacterium]